MHAEEAHRASLGEAAAFDDHFDAAVRWTFAREDARNRWTFNELDRHARRSLPGWRFDGHLARALQRGRDEAQRERVDQLGDQLVLTDEHARAGHEPGSEDRDPVAALSI